jgi:hypothetical protein
VREKEEEEEEEKGRKGKKERYTYRDGLQPITLNGV